MPYNYVRKTLFKTPPRPRRLSDYYLYQIAAELTDDLIKDGWLVSNQRSVCIKNICDCCKFSVPEGYNLAKTLDLYYNWEISADIVEQLDSLHWLAVSALDKMQREWAEEYYVNPVIAIGSPVRLLDGSHGVIDGISSNHAASYLIAIEGQPDHIKLIVPVENVSLIP